MKKIFVTLLILVGSFFTVGNISYAEGELPTINCYGLPGCDSSTDPANPTVGNKEKLQEADNVLFKMLGNIISTLINYVGVISVVSIVIAGFMMLLSGGEEEKINNAKKWITYALIGVFVSMSSFAIINIIDNLTIGGSDQSGTEGGGENKDEKSSTGTTSNGSNNQTASSGSNTGSDSTTSGNSSNSGNSNTSGSSNSRGLSSNTGNNSTSGSTNNSFSPQSLDKNNEIKTGTINVNVDLDDKVAKEQFAKTNTVLLTKFQLNANNENVKVEDLEFKSVGTEANDGTKLNNTFENIRLIKGDFTTKIFDAETSVTNNADTNSDWKITFEEIPDFVVNTNDSDTTVYVIADLKENASIDEGSKITFSKIGSEFKGVITNYRIVPGVDNYSSNEITTK